MSKEVNKASTGIGFMGMLTILFIGLKLCDKIDWSWWWVLAPWWGPVVIVLGIGIVLIVIETIVGFFSTK